MRQDLLADMLTRINNQEKIGGKEVILHPVSNLLRGVLTIMKNFGYVGEFEYIDDKKGGKIKLKLLGKVNKCGVVKPRFPCKVSEYEKFEKRYLPAKGFGIIIVSTPQGLMEHSEAKKKNLGGTLIAYIY